MCRELTTGPLETGASFPTGAFCLDNIPTLVIGAGVRSRSIDDQPLVLASSGPER
jgi:hypothetical protein